MYHRFFLNTDTREIDWAELPVIYEKAVDYVLQAYIIDGASFNIYSVKVCIRYFKY